MKQKLQLYLNNQLIDFGEEEVVIPFTYTLEDFNNPTVIKNSFSKTITIPGTNNNNKVFGEIYNFDREQVYGDSFSGINFNPSQRNPFAIYKNSELIEEGYFQLSSIKRNGNVINYEINLFGGLGDFFYSLKYNNESQPLTMGDINYGVLDLYGRELDMDTIDFKINREFVKDSWDAISGRYNGKQLKHLITFAPSYNGVSSDMDVDKVLINTANSIFPTSSKTSDGTTYTTYNGYALGKLNKKYNEWEMCDLRSYLQRPALSLKHFLDAVANPENNGGYEVNWDKSFFNESNPYYANAYIALPLLSSLEKDGETSISFDVMQPSTFDGYAYVESNNDIITFDADTSVVTINEDSGKINLNVDIQYKITSDVELTEDKYYLAWINRGFWSNDKASHNYKLQVCVVDENDNILYESQINQLNGTKEYVINRIENNNVQYYGYWKRQENGEYLYTTEQGTNTFRFSFSDIRGLSNFKIKIISMASAITVAKAEDFRDDENVINLGLNCFSTNIVTSKSYLVYGENIGTNTTIKLKDILKTEKTPADFFLDYIKTFGLYVVKEKGEKKINILTRNSFFRGNVINWNDKIDRGKEMVINPLIYNKKFFNLVHPTPTTFYAQKYLTQYSNEYGGKMINTNYNFNADIEDVYKDNIYQNVVTVNDSSHYFLSHFTVDNTSVPSFMVDNVNYTRFSSTFEELDEELYGNNYIDYTKTISWNDTYGADMFPKVCFYTLNNNEQSLSEVQSSLLLFNDYKYFRDVEGNNVNYWLTDDVDEMYRLNGNPCYLYTTTSTNASGEEIATLLTSIPQFIRYKIDYTNTITHSLDYAVPKELYIDGVIYPPENTIYGKCWSEFYNEQLNINNKKLSTYVMLDEIQVGNDMFRDFYYFDNAIWLLNKITNYNTNGYGSTACEFIKITNTSSYANGQNIYGEYFELSDTNITVAAEGGDVSVYVYSNQEWEIGSVGANITNYDVYDNLVRVSVGENDTYGDRNLFVYFKILPQIEGGIYENYTMVINQPPLSSKAHKMSGYIKFADGSVPVGAIVRVTRIDSNYYIDNGGVVDVDGYYEVYFPDSLNFTLSIYKGTTDYVEGSTFTGITSDLTRNWTIANIS